MTERRHLDRRGVLAAAGAFVALPQSAWSSETMRTVLFDTAAALDEASQAWRVPVHAWVFEPADSVVRKRAIAALFQRRYGLAVPPEHAGLFDERIDLLLADNKRGRRPALSLAGEAVFQFTGTTRPNGHVRTNFSLPRLRAGSNRVEIVSGAARARVHLVPPEGMSVISDIDDTVKDSNVLDRRKLWESTFFKPFTAVAGMADLLRRLAGNDGAVHYVSSSPWHLYPPLRAFLAAEGFPVSALHLKHIRLKDSTILNITKSPLETKPPVITDILKRWPRRGFILVGDSGEKDPEVYGVIARRHGRQIKSILIRRAPGDGSPPSRFDAAFAGLDRALWQLFDQPSEVIL